MNEEKTRWDHRTMSAATYETWIARTGIMGDGQKPRNGLSLIRDAATGKILSVIEFMPGEHLMSEYSTKVLSPEAAVAAKLIPRTWLSRPPTSPTEQPCAMRRSSSTRAS